MPPTVRWFVTVAAIALLAGCTRSRPAGVLAGEDPFQHRLPENVRAYRAAGFVVIPLARFEAKARVLSAHRYTFGRAARLAPVDLALGWGRMSDSAVLAHVSVTQMARYYAWHVRDLPIPADEIASHSANMHMIPADAAVRRVLERARPGDVVTFSGELVEAHAEDGWSWVSSLSREDTGDGACELVYVRSIAID